MTNSTINEAKKDKDTEESLQETYQYFLLDICRLVSIRDCLASLEQFTRKEHFSLQQEINKLNKEADKFTQIGQSDLDPLIKEKKASGMSGVFKNLGNKLVGKSSKSEKEVYQAIKSHEKKLKIVD